jgi:MerR family transcriptional regulator, heat shock protein HspR
MQTRRTRKLRAMSDSTMNVYVISVAADMVGTGVQNLRAYERAGLVTPGRTAGGTRMYSGDDITRLRRVATLLEAGLNLAGIAMVLELEEENHRLRTRLKRRP